jgi:MFS family permease
LLSCVPVPPTWFFLTLYLQNVRHYTPLQTGLIFVPISLAVIVGSQIGFRVLARLGGRRLLFAGGTIAAAGMLWLAQLAAGGSLLWAVIAPSAITMTGGGLMFAPTTVAATSGLGPDQAGLASGLLNTSRQIGGSLGLAVLATLAGGADQHRAMTAGYAARSRSARRSSRSRDRWRAHPAGSAWPRGGAKGLLNAAQRGR